METYLEGGFDLRPLQNGTRGGGINAGHTIGVTDETGMYAVENVHHIRDFHVSLLRLLGLDDNKLT